MHGGGGNVHNKQSNIIRNKFRRFENRARAIFFFFSVSFLKFGLAGPHKERAKSFKE
jgi:hypothetical protein